jgi:CubicO group peptidase (beta-lactamase class C family)
MKTNYRFLYAIMLLMGFLLISCDDEDEAPAEEGTEEVADKKGSTHNGIYFPGTEEWETSSAVTLGWDTAHLNDAIRYAKEKNSYNLMIIYKGKIVVEEYWKGTNASTQHALESIAKSFTSVVMGKLHSEGKINIDDKVSKYLPAGWSKSPDTEADITIRHLLSMTSGLNTKLEYAARPGEIWRYSHAAFTVLYEVIKSATGGSARDYISRELFSKIGMSNITWSGYDVSSSPRGIAKFGLVMLTRGSWKGEKLIQDDGYFSAMVTPSQPIQAYGFLWWLNGTDSWYDAETQRSIDGPLASTMPSESWLAKGLHDQRIYVVPGLDMVVIRQGEDNGLPDAGEGSFDVEFWKRLMAAIGDDGL